MAVTIPRAHTFTWVCPFGCPPVQLTIPLTDVGPRGGPDEAAHLVLDEDDLRTALAAHFAGNHQDQA